MPLKEEFICCVRILVNRQELLFIKFCFADDASDYFLLNKLYTVFLREQLLQNILGGLFNEPSNVAEA